MEIDTTKMVRYNECGDPILEDMSDEQTEMFVIVQQHNIYRMIDEHNKLLQLADEAQVKAKKAREAADYMGEKVHVVLKFLNIYNPSAGNWFEKTGYEYMENNQ